MASEDMDFTCSLLPSEATPSVAEGDFVGLFRQQGLDRLTQKIMLLLISAKRMKCNLGEVKLVSGTWSEAVDSLVLSTRVGKATYLHRIKRVMRRAVSKVKGRTLTGVFGRNVSLRYVLDKKRRLVNLHYSGLLDSAISLKLLADGEEQLRTIRRFVSFQTWQDYDGIYDRRWQSRHGLKFTGESNFRRLFELKHLLNIITAKSDSQCQEEDLAWKEDILKTPWEKMVFEPRGKKLGHRRIWEAKTNWKHAVKSLLVYHLYWLPIEAEFR